MQCPRCYFDNPAGTRHCAYCGGELGLVVPEPTPPGGAAEKRRTQLGPPPGADAWGGAPPPTTPLDQEDPFELAATGIRGGAAADADKVAVSMATPPRKPAHNPRSTLLDDAAPELDSEIVGCLLVIPETSRATSLVLRQGSTRIGRSRSSHLMLDDPRVSGDHAVIQVEAEQAWILDTSSNGTIVSGERLRMDRAPLADGTVVQFGRTVIVVKLLSNDTLNVLRGAER